VTAPQDGKLTEARFVIFARGVGLAPENNLANIYGYPMDFHVWTDGVEGGADSFDLNPRASQVPGHVDIEVNTPSESFITVVPFGQTGPVNEFTTFLVTVDLSSFNLELEGGNQYVMGLIQDSNNFITGDGFFRISASRATGFEDVFRAWNTNPALRPGYLKSQLGNTFEQYAGAFIMEPEVPATVVGRHVLYNNSAFDAGAAGDDGAMAPDKAALFPGQTAAFVNYTSYSRGLNGIVVDIAGLHDPAALAADDFAFRVGNNDELGDWSAAPSPLSIDVRPGEGAGGADRVTIVWSDNAIQKQWLEVTIESTEDTGLAAADVFYFGNAIGETGNSTANAIVSSADEALARLNLRGPFNPAPIDFLYDFNRDRLVNSADQALARLGVTNAFSSLRLISPPALAASASIAAVPEPGTWLLASLGVVAFAVVARRARRRQGSPPTA
jgi:hypothetical protein